MDRLSTTKHKHAAKKVGVTQSVAPSARGSKVQRSQGSNTVSEMKNKVETTGVAHLLDEAKTMAQDVGGKTMKVVEDVGGQTMKVAKDVAEKATSVARDVGEYAMKAEKKVAKVGGSVLDHVVANPIPYAMIGVGAAWLAIGASASRRESISNAATWLQDTTSNLFDGVSQEASTLAKGASKQARTLASGATTQAKNVSKSVGSAYEEHPFAFGAAVFAASTAIALALPRSERENALMGGARDAIKDKVSSFSRESFDKAQNYAERIFDASTALLDGNGSSKRSRTASA